MTALDVVSLVLAAALLLHLLVALLRGDRAR